jgi:hypothetical protein
MNIHQLSVSYDPLEDRILWRINTTSQQEIEVWLTRRMTANLMPHLPQVAAEQLALSAPIETPLLTEQDKRVFADFKQQESLHQSDFSTPYKVGQTKLLEGGPLVLTDVQIRVQPDGMTLVLLQERERTDQPGRTLELRLKPHLIHGWMHLLQEVWPKTGWSEPPALPGNVQPQHLATGATKRLLN